MKNNNFIVLSSSSRGNSSTLTQEYKATVFGISSVIPKGSSSTGIGISQGTEVHSCEIEVLSWYADEKNENLTSCISEIENGLERTAGIYFISPSKYEVYLPESIFLLGEEAICSYVRDVLRENPHNYVYESAQINNSSGDNSKTTIE